MPIFVDRPGQSPYVADDTRLWVESTRAVDSDGQPAGAIRPQCLLRIATDTNYIHNDRRQLYDEGVDNCNTFCMMNLTLPGMRIPGILNWQVEEQLDNVVQTASFEALDALPLSKISTKLAEPVPNMLYSNEITSSWVQDAIGVTRKVTGDGTNHAGNRKVANYYDTDGYPYLEENVKYRTFANQVIALDDANRFPDPRIPDDDDNDVQDDISWPDSPTGQGSYFILIGREVIRVIGYAKDMGGEISPTPTNFLLVPPGGRAINGVLDGHNQNDEVRLLGFGPYDKGSWCSMGYLNLDDFAPQSSILRPGTCLVSYEGYGDIRGPLSHDFDKQRNYQFTGYWFVTSVEPSLTDDGIPRIKVSLKGTGYMFDKQKMTPGLVRRIKNQFGQWHIGETSGKTTLTADTPSTSRVFRVASTHGFQVDQTVYVGGNDQGQISGIDKTTKEITLRVPLNHTHNSGTSFATGQSIWGSADHSRDIPGDWVDYNSWDPTLPGSYPLKIQTELAQHKAFFDHMTQTQFGSQCEMCRKEQAEWLKTHQKKGADAWKGNRAIGQHIYKESIRVEHPITTYIRLMATLAAASWDHPALGTELVQRFTKIPSKLFDNIRNVQTGLIYNGQLVYDRMVQDKVDKQFDWFSPTYDDTKVLSNRAKISCPFDTSYDSAPFWQPMQDLADLNGAVISVTREGYPVFVPRLFPLRPSGVGYKDLAKTKQFQPETSQWNLSYGGSISAYSPSTDIDSLVTQSFVTANTAFDGTTIQVVTGGTGYKGKSHVIYSGVGGNREGLMFTSGVQQTDQFEIPNLVLGLDWDTQSAAKGQVGWGARFQDQQGDTVISVNPPFYTGSLEISVDTKGYTDTIKKIQRTVNFFVDREIVAPWQDSKDPKVWHYGLKDIDGKFGRNTKEGVEQLQKFVKMPADGKWTQELYKKLSHWLDDNIQFLKFDPMWYVRQPFGWTYYLAAITGAPIIGSKKKSSISPLVGKTFIPDTIASRNAEADWVHQFAKMVVNIGNRRVDESIDKATARTVSSNLADPRIQIGDVLWLNVPGFVEAVNKRGNLIPPFTNGMYVTTISRQIDLEGQGTYTATYSGYRYRGDFNQVLTKSAINDGWDFYFKKEGADS